MKKKVRKVKNTNEKGVKERMKTEMILVQLEKQTSDCMTEDFDKMERVSVQTCVQGASCLYLLVPCDQFNLQTSASKEQFL